MVSQLVWSKAKEIYDDAIASGNTAVYAERNSTEVIKLILGNLLPEQSAVVNV